MKRLLKWAGYGLAGLVALVFAVVGGAFAVSEAMIRWPAEKIEVRTVAARDPGAVARGQRVAKINGCHDCHGTAMEGKLFHDEMPVVRAWGPNLSLLMASQSDADLDRAIRHGVAPDGRRLWIMPSSAFAHLTDQEAGDLIAYLRTFKATGQRQPRIQIGPAGRLGVLMGKFQSEPALVKASAGQRLEDLGPQHALGRDLARACIECHGQDLKGHPMLKSPDLAMVAAYDPADFERLLHTGVAAGGRKLGLMTLVAPARFSGLSSTEIAALQGYLTARAEREIARADVTSAAAH